MFMRALRASSVVRWMEMLRDAGFSGPQSEALIKVIQQMYDEVTGEREMSDGGNQHQ